MGQVPSPLVVVAAGPGCRNAQESQAVGTRLESRGNRGAHRARGSNPGAGGIARCPMFFFLQLSSPHPCSRSKSRTLIVSSCGECPGKYMDKPARVNGFKSRDRRRQKVPDVFLPQTLVAAPYPSSAGTAPASENPMSERNY